jgi:hypothetical protein
MNTSQLQASIYKKSFFMLERSKPLSTLQADRRPGARMGRVRARAWISLGDDQGDTVVESRAWLSHCRTIASRIRSFSVSSERPPSLWKHRSQCARAMGLTRLLARDVLISIRLCRGLDFGVLWVGV